MKHTLAFLLVSAFCGASLVVGCSDDTKSTDPPAEIALNDLGKTMAGVFCDLTFRCCTAMEQTEVFKDFGIMPTTVEECTPAVQGTLDAYIFDALKDGVNAGRLKYDAIAANSCFGTAKDECSTITQSSPLQGAACDKVFVGLVATGGDCASSNECATPDSICLITQVDALGKCQLAPKEGEACPDFQCAEGLNCAFINNMGMCVKPLPDGSTCTSTGQCVSQYCDSMTGTCAPKKAIGEACSFSYECKDAYCDSQTKLCGALKAGGAACAADDECESFDCAVDMKCASTGPACAGM